MWADRQEWIEAEQNRRDTLKSRSGKMASDTQTPARKDWKYRQEALYQEKTVKKNLEPVESSDEVGKSLKGQVENKRDNGRTGG